MKNEVGCLFEIEPNGTFATATAYDIGTVVSGFYDFVVTQRTAEDYEVIYLPLEEWTGWFLD